ncbi:hypothetical protein OH76DRAFT_537104 [Lentinus brumalis]|uniref:Uncharacterized protein n=1 Tax=Lentinus brumalis TaxID=2498619 RepID=A0A371DAG2_9APHY|nr:hypothetical protein OH76DRAFT_537104 [Polyporus brumalis]
MRWTDSLFLSVIVGKYRCGMRGWPPDIPFQNPGYFGKTEPLEILVDLWHKGTLRIVKLTDDECAQAAADPKSVLPNTTLTPTPRPRAETPERVVPLVFHPFDFHELSQPSAASTSSSTPLVLTTTARPPKRKRKQRCDTKLSRTRKLHYGRGVKSREYVYDEESGGEAADPNPKRFCEALSDDFVEEIPAAVADVEGEDEIEEFTEAEPEQEDEIESASESWALGEGSDGAEAGSDVD